ncbi:NAD(P)-binding protein [Aspergillus germanicus]
MTGRACLAKQRAFVYCSTTEEGATESNPHGSHLPRSDMRDIGTFLLEEGIGFAAAQNLASTGRYHLLVGARSQEKADAAVQQLPLLSSDLTPLFIDVSSDASIAAAAKTVSAKFGSLDILINNAGISTSLDHANLGLRKNFRAVFDVNVFGVAVITDEFLPLLRSSTYHDRRILNVTTGLGHIGITLSPTSEFSAKSFALPIYRSSKSALNMITAFDAVTLAEEGISVVLAAPGYMGTNFTGGNGVKEVSQAAVQIVRAATEGDPREYFGTVVDEEGVLEEFGW